jgi:hypothetical protein
MHGACVVWMIVVMWYSGDSPCAHGVDAMTCAMHEVDIEPVRYVNMMDGRGVMSMYDAVMPQRPSLSESRSWFIQECIGALHEDLESLVGHSMAESHVHGSWSVRSLALRQGVIITPDPSASRIPWASQGSLHRHGPLTEDGRGPSVTAAVSDGVLSAPAQRYLDACALAHAFLKHDVETAGRCDASGRWPFPTPEEGASSVEIRQHQEADLFARHLLMPMDALRSACETYGNAAVVASVLDVTPDLARRHADACGFRLWS